MATSRILSQGNNPFSAGAVILDSTPVTDYYLNQEAKKQAKDEALDKYYQDQLASVSSKGLRSQDMNIFADKFKNLQQLYMENKNAIKNPTKYGFEKAQEYNQKRQELMNLPALSKSEQEKENEINKLLADPTKRDLIDVPTLDKALQSHKLPLGSENRESLDLARTPFLAKRLSPQEKTNYIKNLYSFVGKEGKYGEGKKIGNYKIETPYTEEFSTGNILKVAEQAKLDAVSNPSLRRTVKEDFDTLPEAEKIKLANTYEKYFKKPMLNGEDVLAAQVIQAGEVAKESKPTRDSDYENKTALSLANSLAKIAANKAPSQQIQEQGNLFDNIGADTKLQFAGKTLNNGIVTVDKDNTPFNGSVFINKEFIPSNLYSALKSSGADNDVLLANTGFKATVKDGRIVGLTDPYLGYIDRQSMENAQLKFNTESAKAQQPAFGKVQQPNVKKSSGIVWKNK